jgi:hypothetical protein
MENPRYIPKSLHPTKNSAEVSAADWTIPELTRMPVYIQLLEEHAPDLEAPDLLAGRLTHRHHVTHGERHSLLTRRN